MFLPQEDLNNVNEYTFRQDCYIRSFLPGAKVLASFTTECIHT